MRKVSTSVGNDVNSAMTYYTARATLRESFGNTFQEMGLWNYGIPTFEEYGQWVSQQIFSFHRDLLAAPQDKIDARGSTLHVYRFRPLLLRALGVRFVIADGTLTNPLVELVTAENGKAGAAVNLYGQFSPTQIIWVPDYSAAVNLLRGQPDLERRAVLLGDPEPRKELVSASRARLVVLRDGYRVTASAPGQAMLVLPVQFSHCWRIEDSTDADFPRILRANVVQTGSSLKDRWMCGSGSTSSHGGRLVGFRTPAASRFWHSNSRTWMPSMLRLRGSMS
jgi:hypothetical protein